MQTLNWLILCKARIQHKPELLSLDRSQLTPATLSICLLARPEQSLVRQLRGLGTHQSAPEPAHWDKVSGTEVPGGYTGILRNTRERSLMFTSPTRSHLAVHLSLPQITTHYRNSKQWACKLHPACLISISSTRYKTTWTASRWDWSQKQSNYINTALHTNQFDACNQLATSVSLHNLQLKSQAEAGAHL